MLLILKCIKEFSFIQACAQQPSAGILLVILMLLEAERKLLGLGGKQNSEGMVLCKCRDIIIVFQQSNPLVLLILFCYLIPLPHLSLQLNDLSCAWGQLLR